MNKKVRSLLKQGKRVEEIARHLKMSKYDICKLKGQIVQARRNWNKKNSLLQPHRVLITQLMTKKLTVKQIYDHLSLLKIKTSYSATNRFVNHLNKKLRQEGYCAIPAAESIVYFLSLGKFMKDGYKVKVWMYLLRLSHSQHCYHRLVTDSSMETFLQCHASAFKALGGAPHRITKIDCKDINMSDAHHLTRYNYFLYCCGSSFTPKTLQGYGVDCNESIKDFKDRFLATVLHNDFYKLKDQLEYWINTVVNLEIHSISGMVIEKQFLRYEKHTLLKITRYQFFKAMK
jgi:hypothetical protein